MKHNKLQIEVRRDCLHQHYVVTITGRDPDNLANEKAVYTAHADVITAIQQHEGFADRDRAEALAYALGFVNSMREPHKVCELYRRDKCGGAFDNSTALYLHKVDAHSSFTGIGKEEAPESFTAGLQQFEPILQTQYTLEPRAQVAAMLLAGIAAADNLAKHRYVDISYSVQLADELLEYLQNNKPHSNETT